MLEKTKTLVKLAVVVPLAIIGVWIG